MTMWQPELDQHLPRYRALADAIARDLQSGRLQPGERLPTHRDLADVLGVTIGTVSRGYAEAERRGLTRGVIGRGTFLRGEQETAPWDEPSSASKNLIDLSLSLPVSVPEQAEAFARTLQDIAADRRIGALLHYQGDSALPHQRAIAAGWLGRLGIRTDEEQVLVTAGSQHGLNVILSSVFHTGQVLITSELTYPSIKTQAQQYGVKLRGVSMDDEGMCPSALERACQTEPKPAGIYLIPTLQNPTSGILSTSRRQAIVDIANRYNLWIIEDDVHAFLIPHAPAPIASMAPNRTIYLSSVAKSLVPGLRTGFIHAPAALKNRLLTGIHATIWMPPPLMIEVTTRWLNDGTADHLIAAKREETKQRQLLVDTILGSWRPRAHPFGYQVWLELPEPWCGDIFLSEARERGLKIIGASAFAVNRGNVPHAIRLSIGVPTRTDLERGLKILAELLCGHSAVSY